MSSSVKEYVSTGIPRLPVRGLADVLPATPEEARSDEQLSVFGEALARLALAPETSSEQLVLGSEALPIWREDALLLRIVPRAATFLGQAWERDTLSFVDVSIASARLQELVRRLGVRASGAASTPVIPIILPPWEQHSLPAALAAHRVCRAGRRAVMLNGLSADRVGRLPLVRSAPALLISTLGGEGQRRGMEYAKALRSVLRTSAPIILGGPLFSSAYMDSSPTSGAICSVNDPVAALRACGIELSDVM